MSNSTLKAFGIGIALLFVTAAAQAQDIKERSLRFAFQNTADHPVGLGLKRFGELVQSKSGGKITVKLFPGGILGGDLQTVAALQGGTLDFTVLNTGVLAGLDKNTAILDFPYLFNNEREADAVVDGPAGKTLHERLTDKGLIGLSYFENGFRQVTNSRQPIARMEDFQGLRLRVLQLPLFIDMFKTLGSNPVPLPFPEVYPALEQKVVDGQENPLNTIYFSKFHEVQKYVSLTRHVFNPQSVLIAKKSWDRLSQDEQSLIREAAQEAAVYQRQMSREQTEKSLAAIKAAGIAVNEFPPAEVERVRAAIKPVIDQYTKDIDPALVQQVNAEIAKVRAAD